MAYTDKATGHRELVKRQSDTRVLRQWVLNGWTAVIVQSETVTEEEWRGLSKTDAQSLCVSSESSVLGSVTRQYLGSCTVSKGLSSIWATACWGTRVTSQMQRMGDTNMYQVTRTTTVFDVSTPDGTLTKW